MMQVPVYNAEGQVIEQIELDESIFRVPMNQTVVHQALVAQRANARLGTASTKTRGDVSGSTRKLYRQKHTGRARVGGIKSPTRRGGGVAFGPHPRSYRQRLPRKMRRLALRCLLSAKLADGELKVINGFGLDQPKTREVRRILEALGAQSSTLLVTAEADANVYKSARNLEKVKTLPADLLNVVDLLSHRALVMTLDAVRRVEGIWGEKRLEGATSDTN
jgi:large subunit ribosomal protein L4